MQFLSSGSWMESTPSNVPLPLMSPSQNPSVQTSSPAAVSGTLLTADAANESKSSSKTIYVRHPESTVVVVNKGPAPPGPSDPSTLNALTMFPAGLPHHQVLSSNMLQSDPPSANDNPSFTFSFPQTSFPQSPFPQSPFHQPLLPLHPLLQLALMPLAMQCQQAMNQLPQQYMLPPALPNAANLASWPPPTLPFTAPTAVPINAMATPGVVASAAVPTVHVPPPAPSAPSKSSSCDSVRRPVAKYYSSDTPPPVPPPPTMPTMNAMSMPPLHGFPATAALPMAPFAFANGFPEAQNMIWAPPHPLPLLQQHPPLTPCFSPIYPPPLPSTTMSSPLPPHMMWPPLAPVFPLLPNPFTSMQAPILTNLNPVDGRPSRRSVGRLDIQSSLSHDYVPEQEGPPTEFIGFREHLPVYKSYGDKRAFTFLTRYLLDIRDTPFVFSFENVICSLMVLIHDTDASNLQLINTCMGRRMVQDGKVLSNLKYCRFYEKDGLRARYLGHAPQYDAYSLSIATFFPENNDEIGNVGHEVHQARIDALDDFLIIIQQWLMGSTPEKPLPAPENIQRYILPYGIFNYQGVGTERHADDLSCSVREVDPLLISALVVQMLYCQVHTMAFTTDLYVPTRFRQKRVANRRKVDGSVGNMIKENDAKRRKMERPVADLTEIKDDDEEVEDEEVEEIESLTVVPTNVALSLAQDDLTALLTADDNDDCL